jgi:hypothetical protein
MSSILFASFCPPSQENIPPSEASAAAALDSVVACVNCLISILKVPNDRTALRTDLSKTERDQVSRLLAEGSRALSQISQEYQLCSLNVSSMLEDDSRPPPPISELFSATYHVNYAHSVPSSFISDIEPTVDSGTISIGACFPNLNAAEEAFAEYAYRAGFNICRGNSKKEVYQEFACSSRGKVRSRKATDSVRRRNRSSVKKSCKCHIVLRKKDQVWMVTTRTLGHSHELMTPEEIQMTARYRYIPDDIKDRAVALYLGGETPAKVQSLLEEECGGRVTWSMKDMYNMLYRHKPVKKEE